MCRECLLSVYLLEVWDHILSISDIPPWHLLVTQEVKMNLLGIDCYAR